MSSVRQRLESLDATTFDVECGGARHRISIVGGRMRSDNHETEAEAVVAALGADAPECVWYLEAGLHLDAIDPLCLLGSDDEPNPRREMALSRLNEIRATSPSAHAHFQRWLSGYMADSLRLEKLCTLPRGVRDRLAVMGLVEQWPIPPAVERMGHRILDGYSLTDPASLGDLLRGRLALAGLDIEPALWSEEEAAAVARVAFAGPVEFTDWRQVAGPALVPIARALGSREIDPTWLEAVLEALHEDTEVLRSMLLSDGLMVRKGSYYIAGVGT